MPTDIGPPDYKTMMPPMIQRNYGKWLYHEILKPGVLMHIARIGRSALHGARRIAAAAFDGPYPGDMRHCREVL